MTKRMLYTARFIMALAFAGISTQCYGGEMIPAKTQKNDFVAMSYRIEGAYMPYKYIQVDIDNAAQVVLQYCLYQEYVAPGEVPEKTVRFAIDQQMLQKLIALHEQADFFHVQLNDLNRDQMRVTDVGTTTMGYRTKDRERSLSYGFVEDNPLKDIIRMYSDIANMRLPKIERRR